MGRNSCGVKDKLRKGLWSPEEDEKLYNYITRFGVGSWSSVPKLAGLQRCGKSCRLRWINYLRPDLKRGMFSQEEEDLIISLHESLGNRWAQIAAQLPGRTDNEIKNFWNSYLKKKLTKQGIDPNTHKPMIHKTRVKDEKQDRLDSASPQFFGTNGVSNLSTSARMEQHPYQSNASDVEQVQAPKDNFSSKQAYDPTFLTAFQASIDPSGCNSNFVSHYLQNQIEGTDHTHQISAFDSVHNIAKFDHQNAMMPRDYSDSSGSRMSKYSTNKAKDGSTSSSSMIDNGGALCWGTEKNNKLDSVFQFQFSGIQIEDRKPGLWQEGQEGDLSSYPITSSLSQELTNGASLDVFQQI